MRKNKERKLSRFSFGIIKISLFILVFFSFYFYVNTPFVFANSSSSSSSSSSSESYSESYCGEGYSSSESYSESSGSGENSSSSSSSSSSSYSNCEYEYTNIRPVIKLIGETPISITVGPLYLDQGATAQDREDGDITNKIITTNNVDANTVGIYYVIYNVKDSKGLAAETVIRRVEVVPEEQQSPVIIVATKIVCDSESDLPNWGNGGPNISESTATSFIANHSNCHLVSNWKFQWSFADEENKQPAPVLSGDFVGEAVAGEVYSSWNTFGPTNSNGVATTSILNLNKATKIWVREVLKDGYLSFSYPATTSPISAELYCHNDVLNYDNYDSIQSVALGNTYYCVSWNVLKSVTPPVNTPPVLTLVGSNPANIIVGSNYVDMGATAQDQEDGDITANIIATSTVNTNVVGSYTVTYNVSDSKGLQAVPVVRVVNVSELPPPPPSVKGKITFCLMLGDNQNVLATTSSGLPAGSFSLDLATSTFFGSTTISSKTWNTNSFSPNSNIILSNNDADCVTFRELELGSYYYSELSSNGSLWNTPKYSDQYNQPVNNVFDLFVYSSELFNATTSDDSSRNLNSDGSIILDSNNKERTLVLYNTYNPAPQCVLPSITSTLTTTGVAGQTFTYLITATSTDSILVSTSTLPAWLSFATTTNTFSGIPTEAGVFNVSISAINSCATDNQTLNITITAPPAGSPSANISLSKTSDKTTASVGDTITYTLVLSNNGPDNASNVGVSDILPTELDFVSSTSSIGSYSTTTGFWLVGNLNNNASTTLTIVAIVKNGNEGRVLTNTAVASSTQSDPDSTNNTSSVVTNINNPVTPPPPTPTPTPPCTSNCGGGGGGNGPIVGSFGVSNGPIAPQIVTPEVVVNGCYYLLDYLRKDFNNNPVEVRKLQVFLRDLEGFSDIQITGVYDDQTIKYLNEFQNRYAGDILTPWGHTAPTGYTYILTKKKVNEIYCKFAFPLTALQQIEIDNYRNFLQGLINSGVGSINSGVINPPSTSTESVIGQVGSIIEANKNDFDDDSQLVTLAGQSSTTNSIASRFTANVISSGKQFGNLLFSFISWPFGYTFGDAVEQCKSMLGYNFSRTVNLVLIIVIAFMSYLWYRQYKNNKKLEDINKEIDLN